MQVPPFRERTQGFQSQAYCSRAMWPCCDFTSSDDDEHNTDNNFLLLFADIAITPTLLEGLSEIEFSRFRSNFPLHLITSHFLTILCSPHSEHVCYTRLKTDTMASLLRDSHSKSLSVSEEFVVTQCQLKSC